MRISKKWYTSKTLWVNLLAIIGVLTQQYSGQEIISTEMQVLLLPAVNVLLRAITKDEIKW